MVYKIGLISTHGTGKTTLAFGIAEELKKKRLTVRVIGEIATLARERGIPIDKQTSLGAQAWILHRQCAAELEAELYNYDVAICDRTVLDNYCYLQRAVRENHFYLDFVLRHSQQHPYQKLYTLPVLEQLDPQKRDPDPDFQKTIDSLILGFLKEHSIPYFPLPSSREKWVKIIAEQTFQDLNLTP